MNLIDKKLLRTTRDHLLVLGQFSGIALCCYPLLLGNRGEYSYLLLSLLGAVGGVVTLCYNKIGNFNVYPTMKNNAILITSGPYALVRHPMYLFLVMIMLGITLCNFQRLTLIGFTLIVISVSAKALIEEELIAGKFIEYRRYMQRTKRIIPWFW